LHKQGHGGLVVEEAGLKKGQPGQHSEDEYRGEHDPSFITVIQILAAQVSKKRNALNPDH
jgi:hypothetical protein